MPFAEVGDLKVYYEQHGRGELLILIEGFVCNRFVWEDLVSLLSPYFELLIFDNRGSGQTDIPPGPYTIPMMARDTVALMDVLGIAQAHILGHSMGGAIVQQICLDFPARIKKGILCATFAKIAQKALLHLEVQYILFKRMRKELLLHNLLPWLFSNEFLGKKENIEKALQVLGNNPYPPTLTGYLGQAEALRAFDSSSALGKISTPLLILAGDEDFYAPLANAQFLAQKIPQAQLHIFPGQGHLFIQEKAQEFADLVISFLN